LTWLIRKLKSPTYTKGIEEKQSVMVRLILTAILLVLLTACGTVGLEPSSQLVQRAITLQLEQTNSN